VAADEGRASKQLEALGFKIKNTKGKKVVITVPTGGAEGGVGALAGAIAALHDKSVAVGDLHHLLTKAPRGRRARVTATTRSGGNVLRSMPTAACGRTTCSSPARAVGGSWAEDEAGTRPHPARSGRQQASPSVPADRRRDREAAGRRRCGGSPRAASPASPTRRPGGRCSAAPSDAKSRYDQEIEDLKKAWATSPRRSRTRRRPPTTSRPPRRTSSKVRHGPSHGHPAAGGRGARRQGQEGEALGGLDGPQGPRRRQRRRQGTRAEEGRQGAQDLQPEGV
jgi:hypothetical protein